MVLFELSEEVFDVFEVEQQSVLLQVGVDGAFDLSTKCFELDLVLSNLHPFSLAFEQSLLERYSLIELNGSRDMGPLVKDLTLLCVCCIEAEI